MIFFVFFFVTNCKALMKMKKKNFFIPPTCREASHWSFTSFLLPSLFLYICFHTSPSSLYFYTSTHVLVSMSLLFVGTFRLLDIRLYMHKMLISVMNISRVRCTGVQFFSFFRFLAIIYNWIDLVSQSVL